MRIPDAKNVLRVAFKKQRQVLFVGSPGCGKSAIVEQVAKEEGIDIQIINCSHLDPTDLNGLPIRTGDKEADFAVFSDLKKLTTATKPLVAVFEEIAQATTAVQAALMQVWHPGIIGGIPISPHVTLVACANRASDKSGARAVLEALKSRCDTILSIDVTLEDWEDWAVSNHINAKGIAFLRFTSRVDGKNFLNDWKPTVECTNSPCPRSVVNAFKWIDEPEITGNVLFECLKGAAGEGFATELMAFLEVYEKMPDPDYCIANPETVTIPDVTESPDVIYALSGAVARLSEKKNYDNVLMFAARLPKEFEVLLVKDSIRGNKKLVQQPGFQKWIKANKEVLMGD